MSTSKQIASILEALERGSKMETMKNEAQTFLNERTNITPKAGASLVNRAVSVLGKEHSTTRGALSGLIASWSALANDEKTLEADSLEIWYLADALKVFILPLCDAIDSSVKAKQASKADTSKPKLANGKREAWADSQEEAQALRATLEPAKPAKPARGRKTDPQAPAVEADELALIIRAVLEARA
jgi:hypothetical protein